VLATDRITIRRFVGGPMLTTCYAIIAPGRQTVMIDAPRDAWRAALNAAEEAQAPVSLLILTHGHWDHITDAKRVQDLGIPVAGHPADRAFCADPMAQRGGIPFVIEPIQFDRELADGDRLSAGEAEIQVLHTPGHTPGSISLWIPALDALFTGDTVLKGGAGYLERPECDPWALASSVLRVASMPESTSLYPGHGAPTTIAAEPWLAAPASGYPTAREALVTAWQSGQGRWTPR
jgi:glyoxylase-like metal-dependent hydrolase (beta-lactamase superfamily II)